MRAVPPLPLVPREVRDAAAVALRRLQGEYEEDAWGYDAEFARLADPVLEFLYTRWWRAGATGTERIPPRGPVLVVANQGGTLPVDGAMIATAIRRSGVRADPRLLVAPQAFDLPWAGVAVRRFGGVAPTRENAVGLLRDGHLVVGFPAGGRGEPGADRHRLRRFGRGELVEVALRASAPVVPCAIVAPRIPIVGGLGLLPLPARWRVAFGDPIVFRQPPEAAADRALVLELNDLVRDRVQDVVYDTLVQRSGAFR